MKYIIFQYNLFLIGALFILLVFRLLRGLRYRDNNLQREAVILLLGGFIAFLSTQTFAPFHINVSNIKPNFNFVPLNSIRKLFLLGLGFNTPETQHLHHDILYINLLGNLLIFAPVGFLSALLLEEPRWYKSLLAGLTLSLVIEMVQLFIPTRSFDVDDLLLNGIGVLIGYGLFKILCLLKPFKRLAIKTSRSNRPNGPLWAAICVLTIALWALAIFLHQYQGDIRFPIG